MEGDQEIAGARRDAQRREGVFTRHPLDLADLVETRVADQVDVIGVLAHLAQAACRHLVGDEMQVGHLGDRVADTVVESAVHRVAAAEVGDRHPRDHGGLGRREDLVTVAEDHQDIRPQALQDIGEADDAVADRLGDRGHVVAALARLDPGGNREALLLDPPVGEAELGRQVHAGDDDLELQAWIVADQPHGRGKQVVIGAAAGHRADLPFRHATAPLPWGPWRRFERDRVRARAGPRFRSNPRLRALPWP